jgi:sodium transport system ATP-binding protein
MIEAANLSKRFAAVQALRNVSFIAHDGKITGLLGPNGAGKSTTLRILSTVIDADGGEARIDQHDCRKDAMQVRANLGVLPHTSGLYPNLTARENIRYYGRLRGLEPEMLEARILELIETLELREVADRRAKGFSHGQKLKVALARAMVHGPKNVILDEPTNGLDVSAVRSLRDLIRNLKASGCCVLFSSHVMQEVAALCEEIVIIGHGRVVAQGTPEEIRAAMHTDDLEEALMRAIVIVDPS